MVPTLSTKTLKRSWIKIRNYTSRPYYSQMLFCIWKRHSVICLILRFVRIENIMKTLWNLAQQKWPKQHSINVTKWTKYFFFSVRKEKTFWFFVFVFSSTFFIVLCIKRILLYNMNETLHNECMQNKLFYLFSGCASYTSHI